jgi:hypothetical protein
MYIQSGRLAVPVHWNLSSERTLFRGSPCGLPHLIVFGLAGALVDQLGARVAALGNLVLVRGLNRNLKV